MTFRAMQEDLKREKQGRYDAWTSCRFHLLPCLSRPLRKLKSTAYFCVRNQ